MSRPDKIYVGFCHWERKYKTFRSPDTPTEDSHGGAYLWVIGPFRTARGARFMADFGWNNPHCQTVDDAEHLAKREANHET